MLAIGFRSVFKGICALICSDLSQRCSLGLEIRTLCWPVTSNPLINVFLKDPSSKFPQHWEPEVFQKVLGEALRVPLTGTKRPDSWKLLRKRLKRLNSKGIHNKNLIINMKQRVKNMLVRFLDYIQRIHEVMNVWWGSYMFNLIIN